MIHDPSARSPVVTRPLSIIAALTGVLLVGAPALYGQASAAPDTSALSQLHFRFVGPAGNRVSSIVGVPGDPSVAYTGSADGGVWKTTDGGLTWKPVFDHQDVSPVGALAVAPSAHNEVWAGTGETWLIRPYYAMGDGIYKSTDGGRTWHNVGLDDTGHIGRIVVDPRDPNRVFACALGQTFKPSTDQGVYRTLDGGKTWKQVLMVNDSTGCSELSMDAHDPNTLFAGMWQVQIRRWGIYSGGIGSGVYVSHDGGDTWKKLTGHGLPGADHPLGRVAVQVAPSDPERVYALVEDTTPELFRSEDGGGSWKLVNRSHIPDERPPYYTRFAVSPDDENLLYFVSVAYSVSRDGGESVYVPRYGGHDPSGLGSAGGDNHDVWIDPTDPSRILVANDGGPSISTDHGHSYHASVLPNAQMYHVATDNAVPYHVLGNKQDGPSYRGPSRNLGGRSITVSDWTTSAGCEDGYLVADPTDSDVLWGGCDNGRLDRLDLRTGAERDVTVWPESALGWAPKDMKYRWDWVFPIAIDPLDHNRVYAGSQSVHVTTDGGQSWTKISGDLTRNDTTHEDNSGGLVYDNLVTYDGATVYAISPSPVKEGVVWVGSDDGLVHVTRDGGKDWTDVTKNIPDLGSWGVVERIEPSKFDSAAAFVAISRENMGDYAPYVYETRDFGRSWKLISGGVPKSVNSSVNCVAQDPVDPDMLYIGTNKGIYVTWDDGAHWTRLRNNFPSTVVTWLTVQPTFGDLVVGTYGRGIWILDDVSPLRAYGEARAHDAYLFGPRPAYRFRQTADGHERPEGSQVVGENPPYGADLDFWLAKATKDSVTLRVLDAKGDTVRKLKAKGRHGINRVWWDLRYEPAKTIEFRTPPPDAPWADAHRKYTAYGIASPEPGPIVAPGTYTVELAAGGGTLSRKLEVKPDPRSEGTPTSIRAQVDFLLQVRGEIDTVADMINHVERTRRQIEDLEHLLHGSPGADTAVVASARKLEEEAVAVESRLVDVRTTGRSEDIFWHPMKLYGRLSWLITEMDGRAGGGSGGADQGPTAQQRQVNQELRGRISTARTAFRKLVDTDAPALNAALGRAGLKASIEP
ncbi:MAG: glycosyl hydrolase [Gemmatimonadetes bacterium]|nr:glycosyl hydrolase [Gemmatimonadota bacterium]